MKRWLLSSAAAVGLVLALAFCADSEGRPRMVREAARTMAVEKGARLDAIHACGAYMFGAEFGDEIQEPKVTIDCGRLIGIEMKPPAPEPNPKERQEMSL